MAGQTKIDNFICENCGGTMKWNITKQQFECISCRTPVKIETIADKVEEHDFNGYARREETSISFEKASTFITCAACGAEIVMDETSTATVCTMCGSSQVDSAKQSAGVPPDGIIPFKIDKAQAQENFRKWVMTRWFAPTRLKKAYQQGKLDGVYVPFWTYDADAQANYIGRGGKTVEEKDEEGKTKTHTEWYRVSGHVYGSYDDIQVCATTKSAGVAIGHVLPYNTSTGSVPYSSAYLSGFAAQRYAVKADVGFEEAKTIIKSGMTDKAEQQIRHMGYDIADVKSIKIQYNNVRYKNVLLPAWISAFGYSGKKYTYAINGATGKVGGQRPYSIQKIVAAVLAALVAATVMYFYFSEEETEAVQALEAYIAIDTIDNAKTTEEWILIETRENKEGRTSYSLVLPAKESGEL